MRYSLLILISLLVGLSCQKEPRKGYWKIVLMDADNKPLEEYRCHREKSNDNKGSLVVDPVHNQHGSFSASISYDKTQITEGYFGSNFSTYGHHSSFSYTDFKGILYRESGSGTFNYRITREYLNPNHGYYDSTTTGAGTFEIKWLYKKEPKQ